MSAAAESSGLGISKIVGSFDYGSSINFSSSLRPTSTAVDFSRLTFLLLSAIDFLAVAYDYISSSDSSLSSSSELA
jgi:hypothetical protein